MNIYKNLLFLHGYLHDTRFADPPRSYAGGFGNEAASRQAFPPLRGPGVRQQRRATAWAPPAAPVPCGCG